MLLQGCFDTRFITCFIRKQQVLEKPIIIDSVLCFNFATFKRFASTE